MKQIIIFCLASLLISCNGKEKKQQLMVENPSLEIQSQTVETSRNQKKIEKLIYIAKTSGKRELKEKLITIPSSYKSISWSEFEEVNAPSFTYRMSHKLMCKGFFRRSDTTLKECEVVFHFNSSGEMVAAIEKNNYLEYYTNEGQNCSSFSSIELEKIGMKNKFDILLKNKRGSKLQVISALAPIFTGEVGITKKEFIQKNIRYVENNFLEGIDSIDYCVDMSGEDCRLYIFKGDTLNEVKNVF